ncbi:MAG: hypothetical protein ABI132_07045, partial [Rhodanobacteraceae bacterium]
MLKVAMLGDKGNGIVGKTVEGTGDEPNDPRIRGVGRPSLHQPMRQLNIERGSNGQQVSSKNDRRNDIEEHRGFLVRARK